MEKNNDDVWKFHLTKSNKWDALKHILLVTKRLQVTSQHEREHRTYRKRNTEYWSTEITEKRTKRRKLLGAPNVQTPDSNLDIENLSIIEIKEKLKELGVQTLEKLQDILRQELHKN